MNSENAVWEQFALLIRSSFFRGTTVYLTISGKPCPPADAADLVLNEVVAEFIATTLQDC